MEFAGSLVELGTLIPLAVGLILINGLSSLGVFFGIGLFYIFSGLYFRVTCPVEPMKVISAYAVATGIAVSQLHAATLLIGIILLIIGASGVINPIGRHIPKPVIRGVQLSTGILLVTKGVQLMLGQSAFQKMRYAAEPYLQIQHIGPVPIGLLIGGLLGVLTFLLLNNKRVPAAIVVVFTGGLIGLVAGTHEGFGQLRLGFFLPPILASGFPSMEDFTIALVTLALPQFPMTIGNAVVANADLAIQYFPQDGRRVTQRALCLSMAAANIGAFFLGAMPMCHGAGGLASRYRFGARTAGSNMIIGTLFLLLAILFGSQCIAFIHLIPMAALGVLLVFAGAQLSLTILDLRTRKEFFVPILVVGITLASNLAAGFIVGIAAALALRSEKLAV